MWMIVPGRFALVLITGAAIVIATQAHALLALRPGGELPDRASGIVIKIKKEKCEKEKVCDYFAPASSCSNPPCCKRWHFEKNCEPKDQQAADTKPATTCELCSKEVNLPASCVPTFSEAECLKQKAAADKLTTNPSYKTICSCKFQ
jgi:hypothetical protein